MEKFNIRAATMSEVDCIRQFLINHFDNDNPLLLAYIYPQNDEATELTDFISKAVADNLVLMAFETLTNTLVGVLVVDLIDAKSVVSIEPSNVSSINERSNNQSFIDIINILEYVCAKANVCERFNVAQSFHIEIVGVHQKYRRQKIAKKLFESGINLARLRNFKLVSVDCTNVYSSKVAESIGMECVSTVSYDEYNNHLGKCLFAPTAPNTEIQTFIVKL